MLLHFTKCSKIDEPEMLSPRGQCDMTLPSIIYCILSRPLRFVPSHLIKHRLLRCFSSSTSYCTGRTKKV